MLSFGRFSVETVIFDHFRLDGGAMFGSVPKNIWSQKLAADSENCIPLVTRSLLLRSEQRVFLIDLGLGQKWNQKLRQIYGIVSTPQEKLNFSAAEITDIVLTHLHFDHAGGISKYENETLVLCYPTATVHLQKHNLDNAMAPNSRERASYLPENVKILQKAKLNLVQNSVELYPDLWVHQVNGHTYGQQWIELRNAKDSIVFPTDLIPTAHHLALPFSMGYDICTETLLKEKQEFLAQAVDRNWTVVFEHDRDTIAAKVGRDERGHYCVREKLTL